MLTVEEKYCRRYQRYVEVANVDWHAVDINAVDTSHQCQCVGSFKQLHSQKKASESIVSF